LIDDENGAIVDERDGMLCGREDTIVGSDLGIGPAVAGERVSQPPELFLIGDMRGNGIRVDAHDLGVGAGKPGEFRLGCPQLIPSNRSEVEGVKQHDHVLPSVARKLKVALRFTRNAS